LGGQDYPFKGYPDVRQDPDESTCVPICIYIALHIMRERIEGIPELTQEQIEKIIETKDDGTPIGTNIEKMNEKMVATIPHYEFRIDYSGLRWKTIIEDIHEENPLETPVIAMIGQFDTQELNWMPHAVVLLQASNEYVTYFDPFYGELVEPTNSFYRKWEALDNFCVRLKHVPRTQRILEEYAVLKDRDENNE
jgi:hypothetical protein